MDNSTNLFLIASKRKFRFASAKGDLTVEQLWDLPLSAKSGFDLNSVAISVNNELKGLVQESFVETRSNPRRTDLEQMLEVVKTVISVKQEENRLATERAAQVTMRNKIRQAIESKKDQKLQEASLEDLEAQLVAMGG